MKQFIFLMGALVAAGCSGGSGSGGNEQSCELICENDRICQEEEGNPFNLEECMSECGQMGEFYKQAFMDANASCLSAPGCTHEDPCYMEAVESTNPNYLSDPNFMQCLQRQDECSSTQYAFRDDDCYGIVIMLDDLS